MKKILSLVIIALMLFSHPIYPVTLDNNTNIVQQDSAAESDEVVADESLGFHQELKRDLSKEDQVLWVLFFYV